MTPATMTADELTVETFRRQGYLVLMTSEKREIGQVRHASKIGWHSAIGEGTIPLVIVGVSTREEFQQQVDLATDIFGAPFPGNIDGRYFYRVEAAD